MHLLECRYKESLPLTDMWYINGRVESIVLRRKARDFFHNEDSQFNLSAEEEVKKLVASAVTLLQKAISFLPYSRKVLQKKSFPCSASI